MLLIEQSLKPSVTPQSTHLISLNVTPSYTAQPLDENGTKLQNVCRKNKSTSEIALEAMHQVGPLVLSLLSSYNATLGLLPMTVILTAQASKSGTLLPL